MPEQSTAQGRQAFGAEVTRLREERDLSRTELAKRVNVTRSYVSQVESGTTRCRRDFAERCDLALGSATRLVDAWDDLLRSAAYPRYFVAFPKAEATAAYLQAYEVMFIYGLFQTRAYAQALLGDTEALTNRLARQQVLRRENPPMVSVVLDESVLLREVGSTDVMREQLEHLLALSEQENVVLQIAPIGYYPSVKATFSIATQSDLGQVLYLVHAVGGMTTTDSGDILFATRAFTQLQGRALSVDHSRSLIHKVIKERWT